MAAKSSQQTINSPPIGPTYSFSMGWEDNFDFPSSLEMVNNNYHIPFFFSLLLYLPILYFGQMIMRKREPMNLRVPMILWNSGLAIFSTIGFMRVFPEFYHTMTRFGFYHTICDNSWTHVKQTRFWIYLFVLSKIPELCDTFFLVLRKQKLIFLHVYHHASVVIFSWLIYADQIAAARWFCTMNFGVHSIMYTYYVLKGIPDLIYVPKWISMIITSLQTLQMVMGAYVVAASYYNKLIGNQCATNTSMFIVGLVIYLSYLFLFSRFFYNAYLAPRPPRDAKGATGNDKKRA